MSTTYKPALLKALVRVFRRTNALVIPLAELGHEFAAMYWNQTVVYHLRQAAVVTKEAEVVRRIHALSGQYAARSFAELPAIGRSKVEASMSQLLAIDVLRRFHNSKPDEMSPLYEWSAGSPEIELTEDSRAFLRDHGQTLEVLANYHWADYLEGCNRLTPRIIQKVARDGAKRGSLTKYLRILLEYGEKSKCFYCERPFTPDNKAAVDHVIPWSFLLEDPLWNLVPACTRCNGAKSDWLPDAKYIDRLLVRNTHAARTIFDGKVSLMTGADDVRGLYDAAISVNWPGYWVVES
jgi:5-methylcytosine-specific restriction endonuclease McrA